MIKRVLTIPVFALLLLGVSCDHMPDAGFLDQIQNWTVRKCSFLPTIKTLLALLNAHPNWTNAADIADRICQVVGPSPAPRIGMPIMLENVPLNGTYVKTP